MKKEKETLERTCVNCKHEGKAEAEFPCSCCIHNAIDKFEPKPKETNGWIPCSEGLPPKPEKNPLFEDAKVELYLVSVGAEFYPFRAFWNGKDFTDGFSKLDVEAWMPLPEPYKEGMNRE